jgi:hypothetical protein
MRSCNVRYRSDNWRFVLFIFLFHSASAFSQTADYRDVFGENWNKADQYEKENRSWVKPILDKFHVPYGLAMAVVYPELIRYSSLRDKIETGLLKTLYVNMGDEYSDFSVGEYQMKPSFVEKVIKELPRSGIKIPGIRQTSDFNDLKEFRRSIVKELESPGEQLKYLVAFYWICEKKFKISNMDESQKVTFLSTAYNYGFDKNRMQIEAMSGKKYFTTKLHGGDTYSYSDISLFWFEEFSKNSN